jgi:hypothetical protein
MIYKQLHNVKPAEGFFKRNRQRLLANLRAKAHPTANSWILLEGKKETYIYDDGNSVPNLPRPDLQILPRASFLVVHWSRPTILLRFDQHRNWRNSMLHQKETGCL